MFLVSLHPISDERLTNDYVGYRVVAGRLVNNHSSRDKIFTSPGDSCLRRLQIVADLERDRVFLASPERSKNRLVQLANPSLPRNSPSPSFSSLPLARIPAWNYRPPRKTQSTINLDGVRELWSFGRWKLEGKKVNFSCYSFAKKMLRDVSETSVEKKGMQRTRSFSFLFLYRGLFVTKDGRYICNFDVGR